MNTKRNPNEYDLTVIKASGPGLLNPVIHAAKLFSADGFSTQATILCTGRTMFTLPAREGHAVNCPGCLRARG